MLTRSLAGGRLPLKASALILGVTAATSLAVAAETCPRCRKGIRHDHPGPATALGFLGFGLNYHLGYGYGGDAVGVGPDGGDPFYGGPGYPHPSPILRRLGPITPFPVLAGTGSPTPACPHSFGTVGPLGSDRPVIEVEPEPGDPGNDIGYGPFTGTLPYPESVLSPSTAAAATARSNSGARANDPRPLPPGPNSSQGSASNLRQIH